jgi:hypothetical protein
VLIGESHSYFTCYHESHHEDEPYEPRYRASQTPDKDGYGMNHSGMPSYRSKTPSLDFRDYAGYVTHYTNRSLSFASDALNAFAGICSILATQLNTALLFGLPERNFLRALLWADQGSAGPRDEALGLPSWSWAAWDSPVKYEHPGGYPRPGEELRFSYDSLNATSLGTLVKFFVTPAPAADLRPVEEATGWFSPQERLGEEHLRDCVRDMSTEYVPWTETTCVAAGFDWLRCVHSPWAAWQHRELHCSARALVAPIVRRRASCLVFNTTCARLHLVEPPCATTDIADVAAQHYHVAGERGVLYTQFVKKAASSSASESKNSTLVTFRIVDSPWQHRRTHRGHGHSVGTSGNRQEQRLRRRGPVRRSPRPSDCRARGSECARGWYDVSAWRALGVVGDDYEKKRGHLSAGDYWRCRHRRLDAD